MAVDILTGADLSKYDKTEAWCLLGQHGVLKDYDLPFSDRVTVLPSCTVPLDCFDRNNWGRIRAMGNFREVKAVRPLTDAAKLAIVAKSPERVFTQDFANLTRGYPWWGGRRSGERSVHIGDNAIVEEQVMWEAITLLELRRQGIKAEIPQGLIQHQDGKMELIVEEIRSPRESIKRNGPSWDEIFDKITEIGLVPVDSGGHNILVDEEGYTTIIDVNRWVWSPHTDNYRKRLMNEVATAVFSLSSFIPGG